MLSLSQHICGAHFCVNRIVSNNHCFRWSSKQINTDASKQLSLCLGNKGITWANEQMHRFYGLCAYGHGPNGLNTPNNIDLMGTP